MTHEAKFKVGDIVLACHSGKAYKITHVWALDKHGSFGYAARGWRGGKYYGATRRFAESGLTPSHDIDFNQPIERTKLSGTDLL